MDKKNYNPSLPLSSLDQIPTVNEDAKTIVALVKKSGSVSGYKLSDGNVVSKQETVNLAKQGEIKGVGIAHNDGVEYLKSIPDGTEANNLSNLPSISE